MSRTLVELIKSINQADINGDINAQIGESGQLKVHDVDVIAGQDGRLMLDRHGTLVRTFKEWGGRNPLVQWVLDGHTTFTQEFHKAFDSYMAAGDFSAPFHPPEDYAFQFLNSAMEYLEASIGQLPRNDSKYDYLTKSYLPAATVGGLWEVH